MARRTMTYGVMPSREEFDAACLEHDPEDPPEACVANLGFRFGNDPRMGDAHLTQDELWDALLEAYVDFSVVDEAVGDWLSSVLGQLGFEWV